MKHSNLVRLAGKEMQTKHSGPDKKVVSAKPSQLIILPLGSPFASLVMLQLQLCLTPYAGVN